MLRCNLHVSTTGRPCNKAFSRSSNLRRHMRTQHKSAAMTTFIDCSPEVEQRISYHPIALPTPTSSPSPPLLEGLGNEVHRQPRALHGQVAGPGPDQDQLRLDETPAAQQPRLREASQYSPRRYRPLEHAEHLPASQMPNVTSVPRSVPATSNNKRKLSIGQYDRIARSRTSTPTPIYDIKLSSKIPGQVKGVDWITEPSKKAFDQQDAHRRAQWGANRAHQGTCILVSEKWKSVDPLKLLALIDLENCPGADEPRLRYQYSDHCTTWARTAAWYSQWPRGGRDLDTFHDTGEDSPMDASHTCHHDHCIVHLTYEPAYINQDRKSCCEKAKKLRQEHKEIPEHCSKHNPPCLLQVSC